ncbi:hypothetical protein JHD47_09220, partial [Sulfurimonas sp. SAG-AH-194-L11]
MKILHILSYFKPDAAYQENLLTLGQSQLGNDVYILTSNLEPKFESNKSDRCHKYGWFSYENVNVKRIPILFEIVNRFVIFKSLYKEISKINPDL